MMVMEKEKVGDDDDGITVNRIVICSEPSSGCPLNFTMLPYEPSSECIYDDGKKWQVWGSVPTTHCCQNVLTAFTVALAQQAKAGNGDFFIVQENLNKCSGPFRNQSSVSAQSCGFFDVFQGNHQCSTLSISDVTHVQNYETMVNECSQLNSFDDACPKCAKEINIAKDHLFTLLDVKGDQTEKAICTVVLVISLTAQKLSDISSIQDLYRCLPLLNTIETEDYFKMKSSLAKAILAIFLASIGMTLVIKLIKYVSKSRKHEKKPVRNPEIANWPGLYRFSRAEILNAMNFGDERQLLGHGSAGQVYKGVLPSGQLVAVKQIYRSNTSDSFTRELEGLSRVRHPNLVCLFGCCIEDGEQYLVYEYCSAGNLANHLLGKETILTWDRRVSILRDCAFALRYLHNHPDGCIVHRDIKLTNILLTQKLDPKLSDFGLAKMLGMEETKVFTDVRGTIGYMDPEYMSNAKLTAASDIYSFGIVTLQVLSGQRVIELDLAARDQLITKAKDVSIGKRPLKDFEDPKMDGKVNSMDFDSILQVAVMCVARSSKGRPSVEDVFQEMDKALRNTMMDMQAKEETNTFVTPPKSFDLPV
ncbi:hypothetical protein LIER_19242 [Lithospermum erythrorhizon]|uniref:Protein kinase domain-containing protein n=1 Tax=Lithospermum erythrorhizon TaxID=34254 RepID=A0AAV3QGY5_LITER